MSDKANKIEIREVYNELKKYLILQDHECHSKLLTDRLNDFQTKLTAFDAMIDRLGSSISKDIH